MIKTGNDPNKYLDSLPEDRRRDMQALDRLVSEIMQGHARVLWKGVFWGGTEQTILGYGDLTMTGSRGKKVEWFMVGLAMQKRYLSLYVNAVEDRQYVTEKYAAHLGKVKVGKACIQITRFEDVDVDTLKKVVTIARDQLNNANNQ